MTPQTILLHVDAYDTKDHRANYALTIAKKLNATVVAQIYAVQQALPPIMMAAVPPDMMQTQLEAAEAAAKAAKTKFMALAQTMDVSADCHIAEGSVEGCASHFAELARSYDVAIVGQDNAEDNDPLKTPILEGSLFHSGRPIIIVPYVGAIHESTFERAMIGWDGGATAARAAFDALPFLKAFGMATDVVTIFRPGDDETRETSAKAFTEAAKKHGLNIKHESVSNDELSPGQVLLNDASDRGADLLVMGGYGHSKTREFFFGGATKELLKTMTVPIMMAH